MSPSLITSIILQGRIKTGKGIAGGVHGERGWGVQDKVMALDSFNMPEISSPSVIIHGLDYFRSAFIYFHSVIN